MLQASVSYKYKLDSESNELPVSFGIGKTWLHSKNFSSIEKKMKLEKGPTFTTKHLETMC